MIAAWDAKLYDDKHSFVWEKGKGVVELLAPQPGERILDLGCGTGHLTAEIAAVGAHTVGIDQSADMIAQARRQFPDLRFEVCDAREIPFTGEFDAVFSNAALHWIPEAEKVIRGVARALKPNGRFVAEMGGKGNIRRLVEAIAVPAARLASTAAPPPRRGITPALASIPGFWRSMGWRFARRRFSIGPRVLRMAKRDWRHGCACSGG